MRNGLASRLVICVLTYWLLPNACCLVPSASAQPPKKITYDEHIQPLLRESCFSCHNQDKQRGGVAVHNYLAVMEGGSSGKIVEPGNPDGSKLFRVMAHLEEPFMPPKSPKMADDKLNLVRQWIQGGALENSGSVAKKVDKPKTDLVVPASALGKPDGPPPLPPESLTLEPAAATPRGTAVIALATNPWSPLLAVGGPKGVLLFDLEARVLLGVLPFPEGMVQTLKFSRNGSLLLVAGGRQGKSGLVVLFNVRTGERLTQVGEETDAVLAADVSPDQALVALGGPSKVLRVYSTKDGKKVHEIKKHTDWVTAIEFSPDGVLLASGDRSGGLFLWETGSGQEHLTLRGHTAAITDITWRIDSNVVASCSEDTTIRLFEVENGNQIRGWGAHGGGTLGIAFAKDGRIASTGRDRVPKLWDQAGKQLLGFEAQSDVSLKVGLSHDGQHLVVGDWTGEVRVFNAASGQKVGVVTTNPPTPAEQLKGANDRLTKLAALEAQLPAQLTAAEAAVKKATDHANTIAAQVKELDTKAKQAADTAAKAKAAADPSVQAKAAAAAAIPAKDATAKLLAEAAAKAKAASEQQKGNAELTAFAAQSQAIAAKAQTELAAAQKYSQDLAAAAQPLEQQAAATATAATAATAALTAGQQQLAPAQAAVAAEQAKLNQLKSTQALAAKELAALRKYKSRLESVIAHLPQTPPSSPDGGKIGP